MFKINFVNFEQVIAGWASRWIDEIIVAALKIH